MDLVLEINYKAADLRKAYGVMARHFPYRTLGRTPGALIFF